MTFKEESVILPKKSYAGVYVFTLIKAPCLSSNDMKNEFLPNVFFKLINNQNKYKH